MPARDYPLQMPVAHIKQTTPVWCWAACCEMLTNHYGSRVSQAQFAAAFKSRFNDSEVSMAAPNEVSWLLKREGRREIDYYRFVGPGSDPKLSWDDVCNALNRGQLIILGMLQHDVLVIGFGYSFGGGKPYLWVNDPAKEAAENPVKFAWEQVYAKMDSMVMVAQRDVAVLD